jgi:hypothetical protein
VVPVQVKCPDIEQEIDACVEDGLVWTKSVVAEGRGEGEAGEAGKEPVALRL